MTSLLHSKDYIVNEELLKVIKELFDKQDISEQYQSSVFSDVDSPPLNSIGKFNITLKIEGLEGKDNLILTNNKPNKVFELIGTNQRFKTTSLIFIALILGFDYSTVDDFISSNQLMTRVNQMQKILFSKNETEIELSISSEEDSFIFNKYRDKIFAKVNNQHFNIDLIPEKYNSVYLSYRDFILAEHIADVQFVSKGRNFVGYVHREISSEFLFTLNIIKEKLEGVLQEGLRNKQESEKIKTYIQTENTITYIKKAQEILEKIPLPLELLSILRREQYRYYSFREIERLNSQKNAIELNRENLEKELVEVKEKMKVVELSIEEVIKVINSYTVGLPFNFQFHRIKEQLSSFKSKWENLYKSDSLQDFQVGKDEEIVSFSVSSDYFPAMNINSLNGYLDLATNIVKANNRIINLLKVIGENENELVAKLDDYEGYKEKLGKIYNKIDICKSEVKVMEDLAKLFDKLDTYIDITSIESIDRWLKTEGIEKKFEGLIKCLERVSVKYENQTNEQLMNFLLSYEKELLGAQKSKNKVFIFPKQIQDLIKMPKIIQDINAVVKYLELDFIKDNINKIIVEASKETTIHNSIIEVFNRYMVERCKYYFEVTNREICVHPLENYDFEMQEFDIGHKKVSTSEGISGGTDSAMTVRSFASKISNKKFGTILLVDEWGDVGEGLAAKVYENFKGLNSFGFGIFVKVDHFIDNPILTDINY